MADPIRTTRLAPSPTGALHLGNARTFLVNWALARQNGWRIILRIEDLDGPRIKTGAAEQAIEDLRWLGMDWDGPVVYQRNDLGPYEAALKKLREKRLIYPCRCTRRDIELAQSAPHVEDHELRYPGTCRPGPGEATAGETGLNPPAAAETAWRLLVPEGAVEFRDEIRGPRSIDVQAQVGDFVVATKMGLPAYQLAVVVDDARQGVTDVVRGDDLLASTARQLLIYRALELGEGPRWWHLPLVVGPDGRRLAKRHGDTRIASYRDRNVSRQRVVGLIAYWCGALDRPREMETGELLDRLRVERIAPEAVMFGDEEQRWLLGG